MAVSIIIFSSLITIVTTGVQLYFDYRKDILQIENYFSLIKSSYVSSLANSVWLYDDARIEMQLNGLLRLRDIEYVEIRTTDIYDSIPSSQTSLDGGSCSTARSACP